MSHASGQRDKNAAWDLTPEERRNAQWEPPARPELATWEVWPTTSAGCGRGWGDADDPRADHHVIAPGVAFLAWPDERSVTGRVIWCQACWLALVGDLPPQAEPPARQLGMAL